MAAIIGIDISFGKCTVAAFQNGKPGVVGSFAADEYTPEVFTTAKNLASAVLAEQITQAVVTVPAAREPRFMERLYGRARKAELEILRAIYKTSALALAYGFMNKEEGALCVLCNYSKGGFDFSVIVNDDGCYETKSIYGGKDNTIWPDKVVISKIKSGIQESELETKKGKAFILGECTQDVHAALNEIFPVEFARPEMPALGAAVQAAVLSGHSAVKDVLLLEAIHQGLGIEVGKRECHFILERNTLIPTKQTVKIRPVDEDIENFTVHFLLGNSSNASKNETFHVANCWSGNSDSREYTIVVDIDANGLLNIEVKDSEGSTMTSLNKARI